MTAPVPVGQAATLRALATAMFRTAAPVVVVTVLTGIGVATVVAGVPGAWGAGWGGTIAAASSVFTLLVMRRTAAMDPQVVMVASLGSFLLKMIVLLAALFLIGQVAGIDRGSLALSMLAVFVVASIAETWAGYRMRTFIVDPGAGAVTRESSTGMSDSGSGAAAGRDGGHD